MLIIYIFPHPQCCLKHTNVTPEDVFYRYLYSVLERLCSFFCQLLETLSKLPTQQPLDQTKLEEEVTYGKGTVPM